MDNNEKEARLNALRQLLGNTDYMALKYAEGQISDGDYAKAKKQRQAWRDEINELETQMNQE